MKRKQVLDLGYGRGGDTHKYLSSGMSLLVAVDPNKANLTKKNGAIERAQNMILKYSTYVNRVSTEQLYLELKTQPPKIDIIHADPSYPLQVINQNKAIATMTIDNQKLIKEYFEKKKKFDVVDCQFVIHYLFGDKIKLDNFMNNVDTHLKNSGYFIVTTLDGKTVFNLLQEKKTHELTYKDNNGINKTFVKITKLYNDSDFKNINVGAAIDILNPMFSTKEIKEYLVNSDYFINYLDTKYNYICEETGLFKDLLISNKIFFRQMQQNFKKKDYDLIWKLYKPETSMHKAEREYSNMFRYYVFRKPSISKVKIYKKDIII